MANVFTVVDFSPSGLRVVLGSLKEGRPFVYQAVVGNPVPVDGNGRMSKEETIKSLHYLLATVLQQRKKTDPTAEGLGLFVPLFPPDGFLAKEAESRTGSTSDQIQAMDYRNLFTSLANVTQVPGKRVLTMDPLCFYDDEGNALREFPLGRNIRQIAMKADAFLVDEKSYEHYESILSALSLDVYVPLLSPLAALDFLRLYQPPKDFFLLDLGARSTDFAWVKNGRLLDCRRVQVGIDPAVEQAAKTLGLSPKRADELLSLFGVRDEAGFDYATTEGITLPQLSKAFEEAFGSVLAEFSRFASDQQGGETAPLLFLGKGSQLDRMPSFFQEKTGRAVKRFESGVIGARDPSFLASLGALVATGYPYQPKVEEAKRREGTQGLANAAFGRKERN